VTEFARQYLGEWKPDPDFELWLSAWTAFYQASDRIDGHIRYPRTEEEHETCKKAIIAGNYAMSEVLDNYSMSMVDKYSKISIRARAEAVRRLKK
jgi:hypothetical protein